jgi:periplasmic divalent cation tolerance protein
LPKVDSRFWWQGKLDLAQESLLVIKAKESLLAEAISLVKGAHSYAVPEIISMPIVGGNEDYLKWIHSEVSEVRDV